MAENYNSYEHADYDDQEEEDYIDMEVGSHKNFFLGHTISSPVHPHEFEFQMFSSSSERDTTTSPADELFYKGKLLPLHIPPRLEMFEKLLHNKRTDEDTFDEFFSTPLTNTTPTNNTPFESCNISPSESCQVSKELNPAEYFFEYSTDVSEFVIENPKKSWTKKLKLIKQSSISSKLKASQAYLKGLFGKSGSTNADKKESYQLPTNVEKKESYRSSTNVIKASFNKEKVGDFSSGGGGHHRRSFSTAIIKRISTVKTTSSSSSSGSSSSSSSISNGFLKRSNSSSNSEVENSIQSAIAHCKRSQQQQLQFHSRKSLSDVGNCSLSASKIVCEDLERQGHCRG